MQILWLVGLFFGVLLAFLFGLWAFIPILAGLPWRPTAPMRIRKAFEMSDIQPGELVYDLGSGDGRVAILAVREFKARAVGVELSPVHILLSMVLAWSSKVREQTRFQMADFYTVDLRAADVVFAYMTSAQVKHLKPHLEEQLHSGARVVTISFDIDGWEPQAVDRGDLIFLYRMPPQPGSLETFLAKEIDQSEKSSKDAPTLEES